MGKSLALPLINFNPSLMTTQEKVCRIALRKIVYGRDLYAADVSINRSRP